MERDANAGCNYVTCDIIYGDGMPKRSVQAETLHNNYHILETSYLPRRGTVKLFGKALKADAAGSTRCQ